MELYTIRYNLHNYINKDNFDYKNTKDYIFLWKYTLIALFAFLGIIFIYKFKQIQTIGFIIIFILSLFIYIIYFEVGILINSIDDNKYLKEYGNYYEFSNIIFNETFDFIEDDDDYNNNKIVNVNQLLVHDYIINNRSNLDKKDGDYLIINIDNDLIYTEKFNKFIRQYISLIKLEELSGIINIKFDTIILNSNEISINDIFDTTNKIYKYLINKEFSNYYIENGYLYININKYNKSLEYNYFEELVKNNTTNFANTHETKNIFKFDGFDKQKNKYANDQISKIENYKKLYIAIDYNYLNQNKKNLETENYYVYYFLQNLIIELNNDNKFYSNLFNKLKEENKIINLKIKISEIDSNDKIDKNLYIKGFIYKLIDKINYSNKKPNVFINFAKDNDEYNKLLEFLLEYERVKGKIKYNMKYENNKTNEEINDYYYNQIKKNNDLLKYVDVYKLNYVNKYLFIKDDKNELEYNNIIKKYTIENNNYYLINLEELNKINLKYKKILLEYINSKYEKNFKNFNLLFDNFDIKKSKGIKKIIDDYNYEFIKIIIISIVIITIICHIFYTELLRW